MGYMHIPNLYRPEAQTLLLFREVYALEKCDGTSAHLAWHSGVLTYSSGGASATTFRAIFDDEKLRAAFAALGHDDVAVYGEAYGGKMQGMRATYGDALRFIVFDVKIGGIWLTVPNMADVAAKLNLEVVPWRKVSTDLAMLDAERDLPSEIAVRRGIVEPRKREGVVLRPLVELTMSNGERVIAKHKGAESRETKTPRDISVDPAKLIVLTEAQAIADEWVTDERLRHVLQAVARDGADVRDISALGKVIAAMQADVAREAAGEIVDSREARAAIGTATAKIFKALLRKQLEAAS